MVCSPNDNNLNPPTLGPPPDLGFGPIFSPIETPFSDIKIPEGMPEDLLALLQNIFALIPGGKLVPNADDTFKTVFSAVASLLNQLGPYLAIYNFFQALLEMIMCIIDVICALLNPFATVDAIIRLFKRCIPNFLNLFPPLALIAMILALILLLIALIEFLINYIVSIINDLLANINTLSQAIQTGDEEGALAIIQKIASLLCLIEQAFALLIAFQAIFAIIQALMALGGRAPCSPSSVCCDDQYCPPFIRNSPDGLIGNRGRLVYHPQAVSDSTVIRTERWQFVDDNPQSYPFKDIITPINGNTYWPEPFSFSAGNNLVTVVPYTLTFTASINPAAFNISIQNSTARVFVVKDVILTIKPYIGVLAFNNSLNYGTQAPSPLTGTAFGNYNGTIQLAGGLVYEADGITPVLSAFGSQLTIESFIHRNQVITPVIEDATQISFINYTLNINHKVLLKYQLISSGCIPEIANESALVAATTDFSSVISRIGNLPSIDNALSCLNNSLSNLRKDVSLENLAIFQSEITSCLDTLKSDSIETFKNAFSAGVSSYSSSVSIEPDIQFVNAPILVKVQLKDQGENVISTNIPQEARNELASKLSANVSFGSISNFTYDGYEYFTAAITSENSGTGIVSVSFEGNVISEIQNRDNDDVQTSISPIELSYQFVGGFAIGDRDSVNRRDATDVSDS